MSTRERTLRQLLFGVVAVATVAAAIVVPLRLLSRLHIDQRPGGAPSASPQPSEQSVLIPPTYKEGDRVTMPVIFPDGSTAELVYPPGLNLASMGVRPYLTGCGRDFNFFYRQDPRGTWYKGDRPLETYAGAEGSKVTLWRGRQGVDLYLRFRFEDWTVLMYDYADGLSERQRGACARSLHGRQTAEGFLLLSMPNPPHSVAPLAEAGRHLSRPELMLGDLDPGLLLFPGSCQPDPGEDGSGRVDEGSPETFASWCVPEVSMTVHVYDDEDPDFIRAVHGGLEFRKVVLAS
jgi:hypothetical protein